MDQEPKKEYESPKMNVVELSTGVALLQDSGDNYNYNNPDPQNPKGNDLIMDLY